jgi:hypothetical protein
LALRVAWPGSAETTVLRLQVGPVTRVVCDPTA